jgi:hypothetical protein
LGDVFENGNAPLSKTQQENFSWRNQPSTSSDPSITHSPPQFQRLPHPSFT